MHIQPTTWRPPASVAGAPGPSAAVAAPAGAAAAAVDAVAVDAAAAAVDADVPRLSEVPSDAAVAAASRPSVPPPKCEPLPPPPAPPPEKPAWEPLPPPPLPPPPLAKPPPECPAPPVPAPPPSGAPLRRMCAAEPVVATPGCAKQSAAVTPERPSAAVAASPELAQDRVSCRLLELARNIRRPRAYIGHSAFICFVLSRECRPFIWEGANRVDIVEAYDPWAFELCKRECIVDGVCICLEHVEGSDVAEMKPVSESHPLSRCAHFVAAARMDCGLPGPHPASLVGFYSGLGLAMWGTVVDGDCGVDVWCQMLGLPQTPSQRVALREEISDYLMARVDAPWMRGVMLARDQRCRP